MYIDCNQPAIQPTTEIVMYQKQKDSIAKTIKIHNEKNKDNEENIILDSIKKEDMNMITKFLNNIGISFNQFEISNKLSTKYSADDIIKEYFEKENLIFYYSKSKKFISISNQGVWEKFGPFIEIDGFYCYEMFGSEFIETVIEKGAAFVR